METTTFAELGLSANVMAAIDASGYTTPTPIQAGAIPVAVSGRDVLGIAQTGTGKTAAFVLPLLSRLERGRARARMPRSLILEPTRELAAQVSEAFETYGANQKFTMALLIGGVSFADQLKKLDRGVDVLIATPGRLLDHFGRGKLLLTGVEFLVIDEADRMLDMGFIPDIEKICRLLPPRRQTLFFSATMPGEITRLVGQFLKDPERIEVAPPATTAKTIAQRFQFCADDSDRAKREMLRQMIRGQDVQNAIVFCNRKRDVAILLKSLKKHGFNAGALHGDMDQTNRMATLAAFRAGEITLLAASDVAARGLDIPNVSHVFNYDMPWQADDYVHRVGRTGRAGRQGYALAIVTADDIKIVRELEKSAGEPVTWIGDPPGEDAEAAGRRGRGRGRGRGRSAASPASSSRPSAGRARRGGARQDSAPAERPAASVSTGQDAREERQSGGAPTTTRQRRSRRPAGTNQSSAGKPAATPEPGAGVADADKGRAEGRSGGRKPVQDKAAGATENRAKPSRAKPARAKKEAPNDGRKSQAPARGLGDHVPAFLKKPVRAGSS